MKTYYIETISNDKDNITVGYASKYGDFVDFNDRDSYPGELVARIITQKNMLIVGESADDYYKRQARIAARCVELFERANLGGFTEIKSGVYLHERHNLLDECDSNGDHECYKAVKEKQSILFWIVTDSGDGPCQIDDIEDLAKYL